MGRLARDIPGFIVGVGRSGTTLLASILNRHSDVCVTPETAFFIHLNNYGIDEFREQWPESLVTIMKKMHPTKIWDAKPDFILEATQGKYPGIKKIFQLLGSEIADLQGKRYWIEKTPDHLSRYKEIREYFPDAPIIHIVRDGRDVASSLMKVHWASDSFFDNLIRWDIDISKADLIRDDDNNVMTLRFEDLVMDPEDMAKRVCDFFGLAYFSEMLIPDGSEDGLIEKGYDHKSDITKKIDNKKINRWKTGIDDHMKHISSMLIGERLKKYGYETNESENRKKQFACIVNMGPNNHWGNDLDFSIKEIANDRYFYAGKCNSLLSKCDFIILKEIIPYRQFFNDSSSIWQYYFSVLVSILLIKAGVYHLYWIFHGDSKKTKSWKFRELIEKNLARSAEFIVCQCNNVHNCQTAALFDVGKEKIRHFPG